MATLKQAILTEQARLNEPRLHPITLPQLPVDGLILEPLIGRMPAAPSTTTRARDWPRPPMRGADQHVLLRLVHDTVETVPIRLRTDLPADLAKTYTARNNATAAISSPRRWPW